MEFLEYAFEFPRLDPGTDNEHDLAALLACVHGRASVACVFVRLVEQPLSFFSDRSGDRANRYGVDGYRPVAQSLFPTGERVG
jgi:hypothetical protein